MTNKGNKPEKLEDRLAQLEEENAALKERIKYDSVTGAYSRDYMVTRLKEETRNASKYPDYGLIFCLADLDNFKKVNDKISHPVGDKVLKISAGIMIDELKKHKITGIVGRWYAGDEFAYVLNYTDPKQLDKIYGVLESTRERIEKNNPFVYPEARLISNGQIETYEATLPKNIKVTSSLGGVKYNREIHKTSDEMLIVEADEALKMAKIYKNHIKIFGEDKMYPRGSFIKDNKSGFSLIPHAFKMGAQAFVNTLKSRR